MTKADFTHLEPPFVLGVGTAAYQVEGAVTADGRGPSIWDTFCSTPGAIKDGSNGEIACDHYNRMSADVDLINWLGLDGYRFSIAWPRIIPDGVGLVNQKGLDFYDRLIDALLEKNIQPYPTLYHWDLPAALEVNGGWLNRDTAKAFEAYAVTVASRLGDRVPMWLTHNEPWCQAFLGYEHGIHAPGHRNFKEALQCAHNLLLSHGLATRALRGVVKTPVGPALNFTPAYPGTDLAWDVLAAQRQNGYFNSWFLDPIAGWGYPEHMVRHYGDLMPVFPATDMDVIAAPVDVLGINYYERSLVVHDDEDEGVLQLSHLDRPGPATADREIYPKGLGDILRDLYSNYGFQNLLVTENGAAFEEQPDENGFVNDLNRVEFIKQHLQQVADARKDGVPVNGYFAWTLMDNFEWAEGYGPRFGLIHVDYETQKRTIKDSALKYREIIRDNGLEKTVF